MKYYLGIADRPWKHLMKPSKTTSFLLGGAGQESPKQLWPIYLIGYIEAFTYSYCRIFINSFCPKVVLLLPFCFKSLHPLPPKELDRNPTWIHESPNLSRVLDGLKTAIHVLKKSGETNWDTLQETITGISIYIYMYIYIDIPPWEKENNLQKGPGPGGYVSYVRDSESEVLNWCSPVEVNQQQ